MAMFRSLTKAATEVCGIVTTFIEVNSPNPKEWDKLKELLFSAEAAAYLEFSRGTDIKIVLNVLLEKKEELQAKNQWVLALNCVSSIYSKWRKLDRNTNVFDAFYLQLET